MTHHLEVSGLHKAFGDTTVLSGIDFAITRGEVVSILGPSGSGKSTLLRCLNRLESPDGGAVLVNGSAIGPRDDMSPRRRRRAVIAQRRLFGMVFQHFELFPNLTVLENVTVGQKVVLGRSAEEAELRAIQELRRVGLTDKLYATPENLSGGQQQRVGIARAVAMDPEILLFDEPTSALDPELVSEVLGVMRDIATSHETTMLVVTHEVDFARDVSDTMMFMDAGVIVERGRPEQLVQDPQQERTRQYFRRLRVADGGREIA